MALAEKYYGLAAASGHSGAKHRLDKNVSLTKQQHDVIAPPLAGRIRKSTIVPRVNIQTKKKNRKSRAGKDKGCCCM
jgi:hypothetical protein